MTEFVVPRSMPTALAMWGPPRSRTNGPLREGPLRMGEAVRLGKRFSFEKRDQLMHAVFSVTDALAELGKERRGVDRSLGERGDRCFDRGAARIVESIQQLGDATAMLIDRKDHGGDHPVLGGRDF